MSPTPHDDGLAGLLDYWQAAGRNGQWFAHDPAFDADFRARFTALHFAAARRELDGWAGGAEGIGGAEGMLGLLLLLDQFPRNAWRGTGHMYATDPLARHFARQAEARGDMARLAPDLRLFLALPFAHSEDLADQDLSVQLNRRLGASFLAHAEGHREIIRRFGRFPHRNPMLGRTTTPEEAAFLAAGGFAG